MCSKSLRTLGKCDVKLLDLGLRFTEFGAEVRVLSSWAVMKDVIGGYPALKGTHEKSQTTGLF